MLRITVEERAERVTCLRLEGRVIGAWVAELERSCASARCHGGGVCLELAGVSFLGPEGVELLRRLRGEGISIVGCSSFVREQLEGGLDGPSVAGS